MSISLVGRSPSELHHDTAIWAENLISGRTASGSSRLLIVKLMLGPPTSRYESGVPQSRQNPRSTTFELANVAGGFDHCTRSAGKRTKAMKGAPDAFWHMRQ
jgi:hypothetical protein